jgi:hypothetical protein
MVLSVLRNHKIVVCQLLGSLLGRRPGHQLTQLRAGWVRYGATFRFDCQTAKPVIANARPFSSLRAKRRRRADPVAGDDGGGMACHRHRHCERSEAIHLAVQRKDDGLLRFARNDVDGVSHTALSSRRGAPEVLLLASAQRGRGERRMPNAPAASCAIVVVETHE